jgi:glucose-1-phosphate cytidylyltransferase
MVGFAQLSANSEKLSATSLLKSRLVRGPGIERFRNSGKIGCFIAVHPPFSFHLADFDGNDGIKRFRSSQEADIWIKGGYFIFRKEIFDYMRDEEELVLEPFNRLMEKGLLMAYKHEGFWRAMDTLRDRQVLEEMAERGEMPWRPGLDSWHRSEALSPVGAA